MKKIFIKKFKSVYHEINLDLDSKNTIAIIGKNGIGKTNILTAIDWFFDKNMRNMNNKSKLSNNIKPGWASEITLVMDILDEQKEKIINLFKNNSNNWKMNLTKEDFLGFYNVVIKSEEKIAKIINRDFKSEEGLEYKSIYKFLKNKFIETGINLLTDSGKINFKDFFIVDKDNNFVGSNQEKIKIFEDIIVRRANKEIIDLPFSEEEYFILTNINKDIITLENILNVDNMFNAKFIENADEESKIKVNYTLTTLANSNQEDVTDLIDFLNNEFEFEKSIKDISETDKIEDITEEEEEDLSLRISMLYKDINEKANKGVKKLFNNFDIYALPKFSFAENSLIISVEDKNNFEVTERKTEFNSSGYKAFFHFILKLKSTEYKAKKNPNKHFIVLADEPDKNLHISLQRQINEFYNQITNNNTNITFIFTTHSPYLINPEKNNIYIVDRVLKNEDNKKTGSTFISHYIKDLNQMKSIDSLNLLPVFESARILDLNTEKNDLNSYFKGIVKNTRVVYCNPDLLQTASRNLENLLELITNSKFDITLKKEKLNSSITFFEDVIILTPQKLEEMHFNDFSYYLDLVENQNRRLYIG